MLQEGSEFTKTDCYHYFHPMCMQRYVCHHQQQMTVRGEGGEGEEGEEEEGEGEGEVEEGEGEGESRPLECPVCREIIPPGEDESSIRQTCTTKHYFPSR